MSSKPRTLVMLRSDLEATLAMDCVGKRTDALLTVTYHSIASYPLPHRRSNLINFPGEKTIVNKTRTNGAVKNIAGKAEKKLGYATEVVNDAGESAWGFQQSMTKTASAVGRTSTLFLGLPFDVVRHQYANAVRVGHIERSMLAWAKFERAVSALERLTLGPWARRV